MAQLTDDCFAFSGPLLPLSEMERLIGERVVPVAETERVGLRGARGRVTAADIKAPVDLPPFDNSAVDGYAVRHADLREDGDSKLVIAGRLTAGTRADVALKPGQAIRIFTGATRSPISRSISLSGSSGPEKAKQSSVSCAIRWAPRV